MCISPNRRLSLIHHTPQCIVLFLEAYLTTAYSIASQTLPNYRTILRTSFPTTVLFIYMFSNFWDRQRFSAFHCRFFAYVSHIAPVEGKQCVSVQDAFVAASISLLVLGYFGFQFGSPVYPRWGGGGRVGANDCIEPSHLLPTSCRPPLWGLRRGRRRIGLFWPMEPF